MRRFQQMRSLQMFAAVHTMSAKASCGGATALTKTQTIGYQQEPAPTLYLKAPCPWVGAGSAISRPARG